MTMRRFAAEDFNDYLAMSREFYASEATDHPVPEEHFRRTFEEILSGAPLAYGWLLIDQGRPAGYLLASITWSNEFGGRVAWLEEAYLRPEARGRGLGRRALEGAMEELKRLEKVAGFRLEVAPANAAVARLYEKLGFRPVPYDGWCVFL
jgi:ribosomal protein S18 acetylase RimI-like enzyme